MGGTRFKARGIDDDGNVANHAELEQIVTITTLHKPPSPVTKSAKIYSYLQVRGSMPFFWHQDGLTKMYLSGSVQHSVRSFTLHFSELKKDTGDGDIYCINLVRGIKNDNEVMLKRRYEEMVAECKLPFVTYRFFDFHNECHENSDPMIAVVENEIWPRSISRTGLFYMTMSLNSDGSVKREILHE